MQIAQSVLLVLALGTVAAGCQDKPKPAPAPAVTTAAAADPATAAKAYFKQKCVVCHGDHGAGDGPGAAALNPKPRAFAAADWQASVTDEHITKIIVEGGAAAGKSAAMPPNPDLKSKPEVVKELVGIVRGFKK